MRRGLVVGGIGIALIAVASAFTVPKLVDRDASGTTLAHARKVTGQPVLVAIDSGGQQRQYRLYTPSGLPADGRVPLEVVLDEESFPFPEMPDYERLANEQHILLALPVTLSHWKDPVDLRLVSDVVDQLVTNGRVDPDRVYLTGGSHSGLFAYQVACSPVGAKVAGMGGLFAYMLTSTPGAAAIADECHPSHPISIINIHGTTDSFIPLEGRPCFISKETGRQLCVPSQLDVMRFWANADGCAPQESTSTAGPLQTIVWGRCKAGTTVELIVVKGGGHTVDSLTIDGVSPHSRIWDFLSAHPRAPVSQQIPLQARVLSAKAVGTGATRHVVVRLSVNLGATVRLALLRGRATVAIAKPSRLAAGSRTVRLNVPKGLAKGRYKLRVTINAAAGKPVVLERSVAVPR